MPKQNKDRCHHARFGDSCVVNHAKLPNLVILVLVGLIYFWEKMKVFPPLATMQTGTQKSSKG